ncbi:MAG TPA: hypothetical protein VES67_12450 [Vicinamibacterales bacterium]|nr:hypothetical protein [Vicinamibacterales bacterium]
MTFETWTRGSALLFLALAVTSLVFVRVSAQASSSVTYVAVADAGGTPVLGLAAKDFAVRVDDRDQTVLDVRPAAEPVSLVFVIDLHTDDILSVRAAMTSVVDALRERSPATRVGVRLLQSRGVAFASVQDAAAMDRLVGQVISGGYSFLPDIVEAANALEKETTMRRVVLAMVSLEPRTGGRSERLEPQQIAGALKATGTALWGVEIAPSGGITWTETVMARVTHLSGGRGETINNTLSLAKTARGLTDLLLSQYAVTYTLPLPPTGPGDLLIGVRRNGVKVTAPAWATER